MQNIESAVPLTVFEILGFKLKNNNNDNNDNKNWRNGLFAISSMLIFQLKLKFLVNIHVDLSYHSAVSKVEYD